MKRRITGITLLAAAMVLSAPAAFGFGKKKSDCGAPCGATYGGCSPCGGGYTVSYVDQKVTAYKTEWETKDVKVMVNEWVNAKEEFKYVENVPEKKKEKVKVKELVSKEETFKYKVVECKAVKEEFKYLVNEAIVVKQKVKVPEWKTKQESFKYTAQELVTVKEKVKVPEQKATTKDVEVVTYELQPVVTQQTRTVCEWVCVPVTVSCVVTPAPCGGRGGFFGGLCGKKHNDCCEPCPPCPQVVTKTVMQRQMVTRQVVVPVTTYNRVEKKIMQKVTSYETVWVEKEIEVRKCVPVEKTGTRTVAFTVETEKEIDVQSCRQVEKTGTREVLRPFEIEKEGKRLVGVWAEREQEVEVTTWKQVEKTGTREVKKLAQVEKTVKQNFAKQVAYETVVKVPVYTPAPVVVTPCYTPVYNPCATTGGGFRGHGCCK